MEAHIKEVTDRAARNVEKWGEQDLATLALAMSEETGELAQAVLKHRDEGGDRNRIRQEAIDCGALALQILRHFSDEPKRVLYVEPHLFEIKVAIAAEDDEPYCFAKVGDFEGVHRIIAKAAQRGAAIDEVRCDTKFRTVEARYHCESFGWIEDRTSGVDRGTAKGLKTGSGHLLDQGEASDGLGDEPHLQSEPRRSDRDAQRTGMSIFSRITGRFVPPAIRRQPRRGYPDPLAGVVSFLRVASRYDAELDGYSMSVESAPIEEHPAFELLLLQSPWQRERWVRAGNAWIHPGLKPICS